MTYLNYLIFMRHQSCFLVGKESPLQAEIVTQMHLVYQCVYMIPISYFPSPQVQYCTFVYSSLGIVGNSLTFVFTEFQTNCFALHSEDNNKETFSLLVI